MVPAAMKDVRSWGIRAVPLAAAVWLGKRNLLAGLPMANGVMSTAGIVGFPAIVVKVPCASTVVPWGIEAMRVTVCPSAGSGVGGAITQRPGSEGMAGGRAAQGPAP